MLNKNWWFLNFQKEFLNFSFCIRKLAVAFYMVNEIQPKIKLQNIVQCPFNSKLFFVACPQTKILFFFHFFSKIWHSWVKFDVKKGLFDSFSFQKCKLLYTAQYCVKSYGAIYFSKFLDWQQPQKLNIHFVACKTIYTAKLYVLITFLELKLLHRLCLWTFLKLSNVLPNPESPKNIVNMNYL